MTFYKKASCATNRGEDFPLLKRKEITILRHFRLLLLPLFVVEMPAVYKGRKLTPEEALLGSNLKQPDDQMYESDFSERVYSISGSEK